MITQIFKVETDQLGEATICVRACACNRVLMRLPNFQTHFALY